MEKILYEGPATIIYNRDEFPKFMEYFDEVDQVSSSSNEFTYHMDPEGITLKFVSSDTLEVENKSKIYKKSLEHVKITLYGLESRIKISKGRIKGAKEVYEAMGKNIK
ncbi:hypothetical protein CL617_02565 [archaeon]|nr:hypothetical protein [archaeon]|tara:strand:+ start:1757 stop:2080 length:324 start_codon:yes stop_codon:yes gene_type:complete